MKKILFLALSFTLGVLFVESFAQTNPSAGASGYNYLIKGGIPSGAVGDPASITVKGATTSGGGDLELSCGGGANGGWISLITPGGGMSSGGIKFGPSGYPKMTLIGNILTVNGSVDVQYGIEAESIFLGGAPFQSGLIKLGITGNAVVEGKITANEVVVKTDVWADHVFSKEYELMSLPELEQFVNENSHLPGIPTQTEAIANGVNVSEMNVKLLQKVEELTLYVINQNKKIELLEEQVRGLK